MHVSEILKRKGGHLFTIPPRASLMEAARQFREHKIGALAVREAGAEIIGLLTERDVLHSVAIHGPQALNMPVEELMARRVHACTPDDTLTRVTYLMVHNHVRHVLVIVDGAIKGIVSMGDIMKNRLDETELEVNVMRDYVRTLPFLP